MNYIKFLGTAGSRFVVMTQQRASGGIWCKLYGINILIDPGPGCLINALKTRPQTDPSILDIIYLSHKHLDHSCDINLMIEAMTEGGRKKRGHILATRDAMDNDPVLLHYLRSYPEKIIALNAGGEHKVNGLTFRISGAHRHSVETYGFVLSRNGRPCLSYISDTSFFEELIDDYMGSNILVINTLLLEKGDNVEHMSLPEAERIIRAVKPRKAILTHLGVSMLEGRIWEKAGAISKRTGTEVIAAEDGLTVEIEH